jgi:DNA-binding NarL/FixJ family response regulator
MVRDLSELSPRQRAVLVGIVQGKTRTAIGRDLGIGLGTVNTHIRILYDRLGVSNYVLAAIAGDRMIEADRARKDAA